MTAESVDNARDVRQPARRRKGAIALFGIAIVVAAGWWLHTWADERSLLSGLRSDDPSDRKRSAWQVAEGGYPKAAVLIRRLLRGGSVEDGDVRESYVYALGRLGRAADYDLLKRVLERDESGFVRQAAWVAAARVDPDRCEALLSSTPTSGDAWRRIGMAQAWLELPDVRGVGTLLEFAAGDDPGRRAIAGRTLYRTLGPALTAAGRWPLGASPNADGSWPQNLVAEVARRVDEVNLQTLLLETRKHVERSRRIQRSKARLSGARDRMAEFLVSP